MKFLQLCLCTCLTAGGVSQLRAQQTLTPEQQKQAVEALRKALDQPSGTVSTPAGVKVIPPAETLPASETKPVEKSAAQASKDAEAKAKADAKRKEKAAADEQRLLEAEKRAREQQQRYEEKRQAELEAQARRDAELRAKKEKAKAEAEAQAPQTATPVVVQTPAPPLTTTPVVAVTPAVAASAPVLTAEQDRAAREALRRALDQPTTATVPVTQPEVKTPVAEPGTVIAVTPPTVIEPKTTVVAPAASVLSQSEAEAARTALRRKLAEYEAATPVAATPATPDGKTVEATTAMSEQERKAAEARAKAEAKAQAEAEKQRIEEEKRAAKLNAEKGTAPALPPLPIVETKLSATKSQRLADLLNSYRRNQITPAEYHSQRAKILAEPN